MAKPTIAVQTRTEAENYEVWERARAFFGHRSMAAFIASAANEKAARAVAEVADNA